MATFLLLGTVVAVCVTGPHRLQEVDPHPELEAGGWLVASGGSNRHAIVQL